jgi:antitoxin StbD
MTSIAYFKKRETKNCKPNGPIAGRNKIMVTTHQILAEISAGISELKKNPMAVVNEGGGGPVAILNRNEPVFYAIPAKTYEYIYEILEDVELRAIVEARKNQPEIKVNLDEL